VLATKIRHGRLASPFTARDVYRNEWAGLTELRVVQGALEGPRRPSGEQPGRGFCQFCRLLAGLMIGRDVICNAARKDSLPYTVSGRLLTVLRRGPAAGPPYLGQQTAGIHR